MTASAVIPPSVRQAAQAGDANAMLRLSQAHEDAGHSEEAVFWLNRAVHAGSADATVQLGLWHLSGRLGNIDETQGLALIEDTANTGHPVALRILANLLATGTGTEKNWPRAIAATIKAARLGDPNAALQTAMMIPADERFQLIRHTLLYSSAQAGNMAACHQLGLALLDGDDSHWCKIGLGWINRAAEAGDPAALMTLEAHVGERMIKPSAPSLLKRLPWPDLKRYAKLPHTLSYPEANSVWRDPAIKYFPAFLEPRHLDYVLSVGAPHLTRATVNDATKGQIEDDSRTNSFMNFRVIETDLVIESINDRILLAMDSAPQQGDPLSMLHYAPGQAYLPHHDFFDPDYPAHQPSLNAYGQRLRTGLLYLNETYSGGTTKFLELDLEIKGKRGDLLVFSNVDKDGSPNPRSLHAGEPPASGEKWVLSKWAREKKVPILA